MRPLAIVDDLLRGNAEFAATKWDPRESGLQGKPAKRLAIVACMDTRHTVERVLGLQHGDALVVRNAGNMVDDGTLRSLIVAVHLMGVESICVMGHTKCAMTSVGRGEFRIARSIAARTKVPLTDVMRPDFQRWLGGYADVEAHVRRSIALLRGHPLLPDEVEIFGLVYDNDTGRVTPLKE